MSFVTSTVTSAIHFQKQLRLLYRRCVCGFWTELTL